MNKRKTKSKKESDNNLDKKTKTRNVKTQNEKDLIKLKSRYKSVVKEIKQIQKENNEMIDGGKSSEAYINDLPLQSLEDFDSFSKNKTINNSLIQNIKKNKALEKEFDKKEEELKSISDQIRLKTIDILFEKIKLMEDSFSKKSSKT